MRKTKLTFGIMMVMVLISQSLWATTIYVNASVSGGNDDGSSWANAYTYLQDAIGAASSGDQIWVAAGNYYPDEGTGHTDNDRTETFTIASGVKLYGGFEGTETETSQRTDYGHGGTYETTLSGDIDKNSTLDANNSYHVTTINLVSNTTVLDGFTLTMGYAVSDVWSHERGGAMYNHMTGSSSDESSPQINTCYFTENYAEIGGAVYLYANNGTNSTTFTSCTFDNNTVSQSGGALGTAVNDSGENDLTFTSCTFNNNSAGWGGAIYMDTYSNGGNSSISLTGGSITNNSCTELGGFLNMNIDESSSVGSVTLSNISDISGNSADGNGGFLMFFEEATGTAHTVNISNCDFTNNDASNGGVLNADFHGSGSVLSVSATDCSFSGSDASGNGGFLMFNEVATGTEHTVNISNCDFTNNDASYGGVLSTNFYGSGSVLSVSATDCSFSGSDASDWGGVFNFYENDYAGAATHSISVTNCEFTGNSASDGAAVAVRTYGTGTDLGLTISKCLFSGNNATNEGGVFLLYNYDASELTATATNCLFSGNEAADYGGVCVLWAEGSSSSLETDFMNCTFAGNFAPEDDWGDNSAVFDLWVDNNGTVANNVTNSIIWGNNSIIEFWDEEGTGTMSSTYSYSIMEGSNGSGASWNTALGTDGGNNIDLDPKFESEPNPANAPQVVPDHDLLLTNGSPCFGAGSLPGSAPATDKDGRSRPLPAGASNVDMGAFEQYNDGTLPVVLSTFTAQYLNNEAQLSWVTQSEEDNIGWNVYRNAEDDQSNAEQINNELIPGNGTTTEPSYYSFADESELTIEQTYYYWLESIDLGGEIHNYSMTASLTIPEPGNNPNIENPIIYGIETAPNPMTDATNFKLTLRNTASVEIKIYNIRGELVKTLPATLIEADEEQEISWNGKGKNRRDLGSGIYFYRVNANGKTLENNKLIIMK